MQLFEPVTNSPALLVKAVLDTAGNEKKTEPPCSGWLGRLRQQIDVMQNLVNDFGIAGVKILNQVFTPHVPPC